MHNFFTSELTEKGYNSNSNSSNIITFFRGCKINDLRDFAKGKSFNYSVWEKNHIYKNDEFIQDFVTHNGILYACKITTETEPPHKDGIQVIDNYELVDFSGSEQE